MELTEFKSVYLEELDEQLQVMEEEILRLEQEGKSDFGVQRLFRAVHTLKGSSAAMGYSRMKELAHEMEHLLDKVRNQELHVTVQLVNLFLKSLDCMLILKSEIIEQNHETSDISFLVRELQSFAKGKQAYWINIILTDQCEMRLARASLIEARLHELGEVLRTEPSLNEGLDDKAYGHIRWLVSASMQPEELEQFASGLLDVEKVKVEICNPHIEAASNTAIHDAAEHQEEGFSSASLEKLKTQTIRVNVDRLEHLMNLVGELVIDQTRIHQVDKQFYQRFGSDETVEELSQISDHLTRIIGELQDGVMRVRMLPIEQLFNRFPRMVRDLAQVLQKEVELVIEGKDTELDRTLMEEIGDPLIHLIRNAIDHGIESPEIRTALGKPEKGLLRISATHEDNQVVICVEDDGAGIIPDKIRLSAVKKGMIAEQEAVRLSDQEAINLIFHPGFSTVATVSEISGRGVGMDIVRIDIERLNGLIDIQTEPGIGTRFKIRLPLTLAIITGLMIDLCGRTFILPMGNVAEIVRVQPTEIKSVRGIPVVTLRNQVIPVVWLHDMFGYERVQSKKHLPLVIVGRAEKRIALVVDELLGNQEIVIKSLGAYIGKVDGVSGATILGDGRVALILEVAGIMKMLGRAG